MNKRAFVAVLLIIALVSIVAVAYAAGGNQRRGGGGGGCPGGQCPMGGTQIAGTISAIDTSAKTFDLSNANQKVLVAVTADTVIKSGRDAKSFADLQVGQNVCACGTLNNGTLTAKMVNMRPCCRK